MTVTAEKETPALEPPAARASRQRWVLWIALISLLFLTAGTWRVWVTKQLEWRIEELRELGQPVSIKDLAARLKPVPVEQAHAPDRYRAVYSKLQMSEEEAKNVPLIGADMPKPHEPFTSESLAALGQALQSKAAALQELQEALDAGPIYLPEQFLNVNGYITDLSQVVSFAEWITLQAAYELERGDVDKAIQSLRRSTQLMQRFTEKPYLLIDYLVQMAIRHLLLDGIERLACRTDLDEQQLHRVQGLLETIPSGPALKDAIADERAWALDSIKHCMRSNPELYFGKVTPGFLAKAYRISGLYELDMVQYYGFVEQQIEVLNHPLHEQLALASALPEPGGGLSFFYTVLSSWSVTSLDSILKLTFRSDARQSAAVVAIAIERFRLAEGRLPDSLTQLAPRYLSKFPADPYTGTPLIYRIEGKGFAVYSTGEDKTDDGGKRFDASGDMYTPGTDIVFRIVR